MPKEGNEKKKCCHCRGMPSHRHAIPRCSDKITSIPECKDKPIKVTDDVCDAIRTTVQKILGGTGDLDEDVPQLHSDEGICFFAIDFHGDPLEINGFDSSSPLSTYALGSSELAPTHDDPCKKANVNLFEVMMPDQPNFKDNLSQGQYYVKFLAEEGIPSSISHFHWWGMNPFMAAIHSQNVGMDPVLFFKKIATALKKVGLVIGPSEE